MRYLIITYVKKPNGQLDETMEVTRRLRNRDLQSGSIVLDFKECRVIRSSFNGQMVPKDWDKIVGYYYQHYSSTIERLFNENGHRVKETSPT